MSKQFFLSLAICFFCYYHVYNVQGLLLFKEREKKEAFALQ